MRKYSTRERTTRCVVCGYEFRYPYLPPRKTCSQGCWLDYMAQVGRRLAEAAEALRRTTDGSGSAEVQAVRDKALAQ